MICCFLIAFLAAFGFVCAVWTLCGLLLAPDQGTLLYRGPEPVEFARRYLWLREMGLLRCQLTVADPPESWLLWLRERGIDVIFGGSPDSDGREKA